LIAYSFHLLRIVTFLSVIRVRHLWYAYSSVRKKNWYFSWDKM